MAKAARKTSSRRPPDAARILDAALALAAETGWEGVRLRLIADRLGVPMSDIARHYRDLDAVADAWFARLRDAAIARPPRGFARRPAVERVFTVMMRWFDAAAPHRRTTGAMLAAKLWPFHPHHWAPMAFSLSRIVQWFREAALLDATGRRRQAEEIALTAVFLATLAVWLNDDSADQTVTRRFLANRLAGGDRLMARLFGSNIAR